MAYTLRPARGPEEDLAAIRLFGQGLYNWDPKDLDSAKTREDLAARFGLRMALREGHTVVLDNDGKVVGASRITPSPWGIKDADTGEVEHWETVAIHPDHQGKGMSEPLRRAALDTSPAVVIKSRIKNANPKSWSVAEKLGFKHHEADGAERIYVMRRPERALQSASPNITSEPTMKKTATAARTDLALAKLALFEDTAKSVGDWAGNLAGKQGWGDAASGFMKDHGAAVTGGLGGLAAGAIGGQFLGNDIDPRTGKKKTNHLKWLLPLLAAGGGAALGHFGFDPSKAKPEAPAPPTGPTPPALPSSEQQGANLAREVMGVINRRKALAAPAPAQAAPPEGKPWQMSMHGSPPAPAWQPPEFDEAELAPFLHHKKTAAAGDPDALHSGARPAGKKGRGGSPLSRGVGPGGPIANNAQHVKTAAGMPAELLASFKKKRGVKPDTKPAEADTTKVEKTAAHIEIDSVTILADVAAASLTKIAGDIDWKGLWEKNKGTILGGAGAGLLGAGVGAMSSDSEDDDGHPVRNGVLGGLAGAALGAGGGYLYDNPEAMAKLKAMLGMGAKPAAAPGKPPGATSSQSAALGSLLGGGLGAGVGAGVGGVGMHMRNRMPLEPGGQPRGGPAWARALKVLGGTAAGAVGGGAVGGGAGFVGGATDHAINHLGDPAIPAPK